MILLVLAGAPSGRAEIQFDVFLGYDERVREGNWFPVAFEILNDGPTFQGTIIIGPEAGFEANRRVLEMELPTGTRKRAVIPVFSNAGRYTRWDARLLDASGKVVAERAGIQPQDTVAFVPILGALPRSFGGLPSFPKVENRGPELLPAVARLQPDYLPSDPIALEGLSAFYLNSERAVDLKVEQVDALLAWLHGGGHLIVAIEQPGDINAVPWLRSVMPFAPEQLITRSVEGSFERWIASGRRPVGLLSSPSPVPPGQVSRRPARSRAVAPMMDGGQDTADLDPFSGLAPEVDFNTAQIPVVTGRVLDGEALLSIEDQPLIISAPRGWGTVTVLAFSPEREPFRSWKNRPWFWAKLVSVSPDLLVDTDRLRWGGLSIDSLFGAMLDSRQVRKLPVAALLLLLVVYLGVIGPFDQWILKRMGRQMWTWVTFPVYVVLFSGLIYFIGYRLRAGDLEWNELQVVDQLPREEGATLRGRTWVSLYSPVNARYRMLSEQPFATIRAESQLGGQGRGDSSRLSLRYPGKGFEAEAFVPVWVSQVYASDWINPGAALVTGRVSTEGGFVTLHVENHSDLRFNELRLAYAGRLHLLGQLLPGQSLEHSINPDEGTPILEGLGGVLNAASRAAVQRRQAFGGEGSGWLERGLNGVVLASFTEKFANLHANQGQDFIAPMGFDLSHLVDRGEAVLFGWAGGQSIANPIHRFSPRRLQRDVVLRVVLPVPPSA